MGGEKEIASQKAHFFVWPASVIPTLSTTVPPVLFFQKQAFTGNLQSCVDYHCERAYTCFYSNFSPIHSIFEETRQEFFCSHMSSHSSFYASDTIIAWYRMKISKHWKLRRIGNLFCFETELNVDADNPSLLTSPPGWQLECWRGRFMTEQFVLFIPLWWD